MIFDAANPNTADDCGAGRHGRTDRVTFHARDAGEALLNGRYGLVTAFECIHNMGDPVSVLQTMRRLANGTVMRAETMRDYALAAGFREVEVLPIDNSFFRLYRLYP